MNQDERLGSLVTAYEYYFETKANVIFDCGTRDGDDAAYLKEQLNATHVYAIDALPSACEITQRNHPDLVVINTALSNYEGSASFTRIVSDRKDYAGSSSLVLAPGWQSVEKEVIQTPVTTMAKLIETLGLQNTMLDIVKVDIEGFSYEFLEGMGDYIHNAKVMHIETETFERHPGHHDSQQVSAYMLSKGFMLDSVSYEWGPSIEDQLWVNEAVE
jgi:FkbM family methyltransferase